MANTVVRETSLPGLPVRRGKVRDVYDLGDRLLLVSTDRISAFDWVLPTAIPDKGRVLTQIAAFWFESARRAEPPDHHRRRADGPAGRGRSRPAGRPLDALPQDGSRADRVRGPRLSGRLGLEGIPAERHGLRHQAARRPDREQPPAGADLHARRPRPPRATTRTSRSSGWWRSWAAIWPRSCGGGACGSFSAARNTPGSGASSSPTRSSSSARWADELLLIDEVLTPDSSRFWPADQYAPGRGQPSFDKQFVRDWLSSTDWDKNSPPPALPDDVVAKTRQKYIEAYERLTDREFG